jgi:hypothetical protein
MRHRAPVPDVLQRSPAAYVRHKIANPCLGDVMWIIVFTTVYIL